MNSLVSVIIPVFNQESYIGDCIRSIIAQTYAHLEIIVIDDACTDKTLKVLDTFPDPRIRVITNQVNMGLAASVNTAIRISRGDFLARMDADDIALPDRIEKQIKFLQVNAEVSIVGTAMKSFGHSDFLHLFPETHDSCKAQLLFNVCFGHPTVMFRRSVFNDQSSFYKNELKQYSEEYDLWCRLVDRYNFANLQEPLLQYRTFPPQEKAAGEKQRRYNSLKIRNEFIKAQLSGATNGELDIHEHVANLDKAASQKELGVWLDWLDRISSLNKLTKSFSSPALEKELRKRGLELSYWNTQLGFSQWRKTITRLGFGDHFDMLTHLKFLIKSLISR